ncbi:DNA binding methylated-DNA--cysteine S-methyltransferase [Pavlovales sp. CCMP2436]|nr:DNA binding methylated-DNA--cysteine S-methyltransferase [Pavlovales sp. CCMP2436]
MHPGRAATAFEQRVYAVCSQIPAGRVSTYGAIARVLDSSARAVGGALRRNPYAPTVPCHRVVAADLTLGGFTGVWDAASPELSRKEKLLRAEGVHILTAGRCVNI